jgi:hypothetical protein
MNDDVSGKIARQVDRSESMGKIVNLEPSPDYRQVLIAYDTGDIFVLDTSSGEYDMVWTADCRRGGQTKGQQ